MKLTELEPEWMTMPDKDGIFRWVETIQEADGIQFLCPVCFKNNGNSNIGTHVIWCWRPRVPQTIPPVPGRWEFEGTGFHDVSLVAGSSSILLQNPKGCRAHFFIKNGEITY